MKNPIKTLFKIKHWTSFNEHILIQFSLNRILCTPLQKLDVKAVTKWHKNNITVPYRDGVNTQVLNAWNSKTSQWVRNNFNTLFLKQQYVVLCYIKERKNKNEYKELLNMLQTFTINRNTETNWVLYDIACYILFIYYFSVCLNFNAVFLKQY